ncbi:hypothetical protein HDU82_004453 [Entophlyctis luteolus]|nr:hypothetical protein HDU82_004453 [Entophlyctis luteolus]
MRQLRAFGLESTATALTMEAGLDAQAIATPSSTLFERFTRSARDTADDGLDEEDEEGDKHDEIGGDSAPLPVRAGPRLDVEILHRTDLEVHKIPSYISWFTTQHKGAVRAAAFSADGAYFATCSADFSLKVLDVSKIHACRKDPSSASSDKPAIRTFYDHQAPANDVAFHPNGSILVSCSDDMTVRLYDLHRANVKRGFRYLQDACPVRCVDFHPTGDFLLVGSDHEIVRMYDIQTFKCFKPAAPAAGDQLIEIVTHSSVKAKWSPTGNFFATSSSDGTIRLYDGASGKPTTTIRQAHGGASVTSVEFSRDGKHILSCGLDSLPRIWDVGSGRVVQTFEGSIQRNPRVNAAFSDNNSIVLAIDDDSNCIVAWDTKTGTLLNRYPAMHASNARSVAASPTDSGFVTVSEDSRARYWFDEDEMPDCLRLCLDRIGFGTGEESSTLATAARRAPLYADICAPANSVLAFATPSSVGVSVNKSVSDKLRSSYSMAIPSARSAGFLYTSQDLRVRADDDVNVFAREVVALPAAPVEAEVDLTPPIATSSEAPITMHEPEKSRLDERVGDDKYHTLMYGRLFEDFRLEALVAQKFSDCDLVSVSGISRWKNDEKSHLEVQYIHREKDWCADVSYSSVDNVIGTSCLVNIPYNDWSVGGEVVYTASEKSGGISLGARWIKYHSQGTSSVLTFVTNPMMGHYNTTYTATIRPNFILATSYEINSYSYNSDISVGVAFSPEDSTNRLLKCRFSMTQGIALLLEGQFKRSIIGLGVSTNLGLGDNLRQGIGLEVQLF